MKISTRKLLLNRYVIFCFGFVLLFQLFSYWVLSGSLEVIFKMGWDWYLKTGPSFSIYPVSGFNLLQTVFPLVASILALPFLYERVNYSFIYHRTSSYRRYIMKRMMITLLWGCVVVYVAYLIFLFIGAAVLPADQDIPRQLFSEITGENFANEHPVLYYVLEGFVRYILFLFVYGLFTVAVSFWTEKIYLCVLIPMIYYGAGGLLVSVIEAILHNFQWNVNLFFLSPAYPIMSNSRAYISGWAILAPFLPILLFSIGSIVYSLYNHKGRDVYAA